MHAIIASSNDVYSCTEYMKKASWMYCPRYHHRSNIFNLSIQILPWWFSVHCSCNWLTTTPNLWFCNRPTSSDLKKMTLWFKHKMNKDELYGNNLFENTEIIISLNCNSQLFFFFSGFGDRYAVYYLVYQIGSAIHSFISQFICVNTEWLQMKIAFRKQ